MDYKETLLTRLEVSPRGELVAEFRGLGDLTFPNWLNTFCLLSGKKWDPSSWEFVKRVIGELERKGPQEVVQTSQNSQKSRTISKGLVVYQIDLPVSSKKQLPKEFVRGNYTKLARFKLKSPWHYVPLPLRILGGLESRQDIENRLSHIKNQLGNVCGPYSGNRNFNKILKSLTYQDLSSPRDLEGLLGSNQARLVPPKLFLDIKEIQKQIAITNDILGDQGDIGVSFKNIPQSGNLLRLDAYDWDFLKRGRMISREELFENPTWFLDIEIPLFRGEDPLISWVGSGVISPRSQRYFIDTIHNLDTSNMENFSIESHESEEALIDSLSRRIRSMDPLVVSAHNAKFDLTKLRESTAGFPIGEDESPPLFKVTTPFFERLGIRDRLVLDTMRWYKIAHAYDLNAKLELMTGEEKSISYDEMESLERGDVKDKLQIANYLTEDIKRPIERVFLSEGFRKNIEDVLEIARIFNISPERLLHSPNCINEAQERAYFSELGVYREEVPPNHRTTTMQKKRTKARNTFSQMVVEKGVHKKNPQGIFDQVVKAYIPVGNILRDLVCHRFPEAKDFYSYRDSQIQDPKRLFFIEQYSHALARWLIEGYGEYLIQAKRLIDLRGDIPRLNLEMAHSSLLSNSRELDPKDRAALACGRLSPRGLERSMTPQARELMVKSGFNATVFLDIINSLSKFKRVERRFIGNFDVFPTKRTAENLRECSKDYLVVNDVLRGAFEDINAFFGENGLEVIAQEGNYLYLHGQIQATKDPCCPVIPVDSIQRLFNSDNPYYKKGRFYSHLRVGDDPSFHLSKFEMESLKPMLEALLGGDFSLARRIYSDAVDTLERKSIPPEDLIFKNKNRGQYFIYSILSAGKTYFVSSEKDVPKDTPIYEKKGQRCFLDPESEQEIKIMGFEEASKQINREVYFSKFIQRGRAMLGKNLCGRSKEKFNPEQGTFNF